MAENPVIEGQVVGEIRPALDRSRPKGFPPIEQYREGLEKALHYDTNGGTFDPVVSAVQMQTAQYWPVSEDSVIITQVAGTTLHFWLATGKIDELQQVTPIILAWGKDLGCTRATLAGRRGWLRSFLRDSGWKQSKVVQMEVEL